MKVSYDIYKTLLETPPIVPPECGGILGGKNGEVINIAFDKSAKIYNSAVYNPNIDYLNEIIAYWNNQGIDFLGIFHTHMQNNTTLSNDDISNIRKIMMCMPNVIRVLYFPIVVPRKGVFPYIAKKNKSKIIIQTDELIVLD